MTNQRADGAVNQMIGGAEPRQGHDDQHQAEATIVALGQFSASALQPEDGQAEGNLRGAEGAGGNRVRGPDKAGCISC